MLSAYKDKKPAPPAAEPQKAPAPAPAAKPAAPAAKVSIFMLSRGVSGLLCGDGVS